VHNIDIDCNEVSTYTATEVLSIKDPDREQPVREYSENVTKIDHAKGFGVLYGGRLFTIAPGMTRNLPRYIAEHFAKHLIDHLLNKRDLDGRLNLINNEGEREKLYNQIIIDEELLYNDAVSQTSVKTISRTKDDDYLELTEDDDIEPNVAIKDESPEVTETEILKEKDEQVSIGRVKTSRQQLMKDCKTLGIKFTVKETNEELVSKIDKFSGA
jgi:hypothetical protein